MRGASTGVAARRSRRVRRWAATTVLLAGLIDLATTLTHRHPEHLHLLVQLLPLGATQAARAMVALAGAALVALARGIRRGQRRAWAISAILLGATLVLHVVSGGDVGGSVVAALALAQLAAGHTHFRAPSDVRSIRSTAPWLVLGVVVVTVASMLATEIALHAQRGQRRLAVRLVSEAVVERFVGRRGVVLPGRLDHFLAPSLLAIGVGIALAALLLATRPPVDRRRPPGRAAWATARDIVRRHGHGTLDYFALRGDKQWFFHGDSLVAYAIFGGICLVSPDPIGPRSDREQVWAAFRRFADRLGWVIAVMAGSEEWLALYRETGMHAIYIGDEAVVDVQRFSLAGGSMKGLRQAYHRIARHGYRADFYDPALVEPDRAERLTRLMPQNRRGEFERGFSMMLGRIFDRRDEGLLLCVVTGPDGWPAAMCQMVPAPAIGGFSLDLMRRDTGEHPNGLIDFALVSTIEHLREQGYRGLSLYFAGLRSVIAGEGGDGSIQRAERWAVKKMSRFLPIETLVRFNAKYKPAWLPRYVVYDGPEYLVPSVLAILRAESLEEVPFIGPMITSSRARRFRRPLDAERDDPFDLVASSRRDGP